MLPHSGSDASNRLRRAKSASSVQERRKHPLRSESVDPNTARLYALVAAHRAMDRSSERTFDELRRSSSSTSKRRAAGQSFRTQNVRFPPASEMRRQRSRPQQRTPAPPSIASTLYVPTEASNTYIDDNQYTSSPMSEFGRAENYGAEPSSYRRLRKAKSMLTPRRRAMSNQDPMTIPTIPLYTSGRLRSMNSSRGLAGDGFKLGLKRSISFLRPSENIANRLKKPEHGTQCHEEAVQMAREQYLKDLQEHKIRAKPSLLFPSKIKRPRKVFRKSVRTSRLTSFGNGVKSENQPNFEDKPESRMRTISSSFRDKVMRVFGKSVSDKDKFPPQQLDASRQYFTECVDGSATDTNAFDHYHTGELEKSSRRSFYVPTQQDQEPIEDLDKLSANLQTAASRESLHSAARSRVTSWTNSTVSGSLRGATPLERKRLSIIKEDGGPHQPSSSAGRHLGGVGVFQEPMGTPVDSHRIYSALMRRIDQEQVEMERAQKELVEIHQEQQRANKQGWRNMTTIRSVHSQSSLHSFTPDSEYREFIVGVPIGEEQNGVMTEEQHSKNVERRKKKLEAQEAQSSFFPFSMGGDRNLATTPSPFKLALLQRKKARETETETETETEEKSESGDESVAYHSPDDAPKRPHRQLDLHQGKFGMKSDESIYSRTTNGGTNATYVLPVGSTEDVEIRPESKDANTVGLGMATIIPTKTNLYQHPRSTERLDWLQRQRSQSGTSAEKQSSEWKGWLEREMEMHNGGQTGRSGARLESKTIQRSHVRENAQIDGDDVEVGNGGAATRFPLLELKEVLRSNTPAPRRNGSFVKSHSGLLLKRRSTASVNDENQRLESMESERRTLSLTKASPGNAVRLLRGKKSGLGLFGSAKKENGSTRDIETIKKPARSAEHGDSPPVSTPGRLMVMYSAGGRGQKNEHKVTPTGAVTKKKKGTYRFRNGGSEQDAMSEGEEEDGSPVAAGSSTPNMNKCLFSARLSRPFDMDIPGQNRPFDSMFLGKGGDVLGLGFGGGDGSGAGAGAGRLSVAPPGIGTRVGGVHAPLDGTPTSLDATNTPASTSSVGAGGSTKGFSGLGFSSKRMVSNFLRSRRRTESPASQHDGKSSPAFL